MHPDLSPAAGEGAEAVPPPRQATRAIALLGQPNSGKTTLFNALTGSHSRTANYPGATVEFSIGTLQESLGWAATVVDLPGIASLVPRSPDEEVALRSLFGEADHPAPSAVIAVVDCSQLSRHLYLARQVIATGIPTAVALTMSDLLGRRGYEVDARKLEGALGCPVVVVDGRSGAGVPELVARAKAMAGAAKLPRRPQEATADEVKAAYREVELIERSATRLAMRPGPASSAHDSDPTTRAIDSVLLHPVWGLVGFVLVMGALFTGVFWLARPVMDAISAGFDTLADAIVGLAPSSFLAKLLGDGVIRGAGAVLTFLPQIVILFFGLGLMEDSGYLARAAVLVDRPLALIGLNGRSFVPLLSGFACAIPGMMAARTIPNRRERLLTIFILPLMSCSARLPVYALLLAFLTPADRPWIGGLALAAIYLASVASGTIVAALVSRLVRAKGPSAFMLELPAYRRPQLAIIARSTYHRSRSYLAKAGVPILVLSTALWLLCNLPPVPANGLPAAEAQARQLEGSAAARLGRWMEPVMQPLGLDWRVGVSLIAAFTAREIFVGSLAIIFHVAGEDDDSVQQSLLATMARARHADGTPIFTVATSVGLIVFFIFAMQCLSTAAVARREAGGWWMPVAQTLAFTGLAYGAAWMAVHGLRAAGVA